HDYDRVFPMAAQAPAAKMAREKGLGVTVEARYTIGEYDILILSAKESTGLETWLTQNGYRIPPGASAVLGSYIKQGMRFFVEQVRREDMRSVFLEYAWDMSWCDPCAADPLSREELRQLGVFWLDEGGAGVNVFLTRLHVRYDAAHFPEDLTFQETGDRQNF